MGLMAWHFVGNTLRDGRPVPADGVWLKHAGPLELCASGLHASVHPFDALQYAPWATLCRVEVDGKTLTGNDKVVARKRRIIARIDATELCRSFARRCALNVIHLWDAPQIVRDYLTTGDESLMAAARDAAWDAAMDVAMDAAWDAARAAAMDVAMDAAWDAARDAASAAARDAARAAARDAQRATFAQMVSEAFSARGVEV